MKLVEYNEKLSSEWNALVQSSRNATFLLDRRFMDYHADRFVDASLMFFKDNRPIGLLPASRHDSRIVSHGGLTYGGFVLSSAVHASDVGEMMSLVLEHYRQHGMQSIVFKPIPYIYHLLPSDDELYWLYRHGAKLVARGLSSAISLTTPLPFSTLRQRKVKLAQRLGIEIRQTNEYTDYQEYWSILTDVISMRHGKAPVHTFDEITLLQQRFPDNIRLYVAISPGTRHVIAGSLLFITSQVVHAQYIAASREGQESGALDLLFSRVVEQYATEGCHQYFDFGISTEDGGSYLNKGLNFQKEGFGARSIVYDAYEVAL